jgi:hypothetical protein
MIWLLLITTFALGIYIIKSRDDLRKQERVQRGSIDALLAAIGEDEKRMELIHRYFINLEKNLSTTDYEAMLKNACVATAIIPEFNKNGRVSASTLRHLVGAFTKYAEDMSDSI